MTRRILWTLGILVLLWAMSNDRQVLDAGEIDRLQDEVIELEYQLELCRAESDGSAIAGGIETEPPLLNVNRVSGN